MPKFMSSHTVPPGAMRREQVNQLAEAAKRMLEHDRLTVQEVSLAVGYEDVAFFRDLFKRHAHLSPSAYRERFGRMIQPIAA